MDDLSAHLSSSIAHQKAIRISPEMRGTKGEERWAEGMNWAGRSLKTWGNKSMKTKLIWRLSKLPEPSELAKLVELKIITQEEAKAILLKQEDDDGRDRKSLEDEIKFLRELVDKLSQNKNSIVEVIKTIEVEVPIYKNNRWYDPYKFYCSTAPEQYQLAAVNNSNFSDIRNF